MITYRVSKFEDNGFTKVRFSICEAKVIRGIVTNIGYSIEVECAIDNDYDPKDALYWSSLLISGNLLGARDHKLFSFVGQLLRDCDNKALRSPNEILELLEEKGAKQLYQVVTKSPNGFADYQWALTPFAKVFKALTSSGEVYTQKAAPTKAHFYRYLRDTNNNWATFTIEPIETYSHKLIKDMALIGELKNW